jgi:transcriptional regulator of acetoin/glycerol metabolism
VPAVKDGRVAESHEGRLRRRRGAFPATARPVPKDWEDYLAQTPAEQVARASYRAARPQRSGNIARVARLMRVTRRTIYLRLDRYGSSASASARPPAAPPLHA